MIVCYEICSFQLAYKAPAIILLLRLLLDTFSACIHLHEHLLCILLSQSVINQVFRQQGAIDGFGSVCNLVENSGRLLLPAVQSQSGCDMQPATQSPGACHPAS